jgi:hypothetical protein
MTQYIGNYTGPFWSDGKIQSSVEWGKEDPESQLDFLSRQHDSAYAHYKGQPKMLEAADEIYAENAKKLVGQFPHLAGNLVQYGNYTGRAATKLLNDVKNANMILPGIGTLLGLGKFSIEGMMDNMKRIDGKYLDKEKKAIHAFYATDKKVSPYSTAYRNPDEVPMLGSIGKKSESRNLVPSGNGKTTLPPLNGPAVSPSMPPALNLSAADQASIHHAQLILSQKKKFQKYSALNQAAHQSAKNRVLPVDVPDWNAFGYQGRRKKMLRAKLKPIG